ncbi:hypothetical protein [Salinibacterium sp. ZJ450]|uniref:hypothetical protein n=1 Tax=Salinibacterium sp. ZJ450 TaxID=2708338 RepID=UPI00141D8540|nr:hypothetical protein [Salinibacterium sp. ZJ450]
MTPDNPTYVAAHARAELPTPGPPKRSKAFDLAAVLVLVIGTILFAFPGTIVGLVMLWISRSWTRWEKVVATALAPAVAVGAGIVVVLTRNATPQPFIEVHDPVLPLAYDVYWSAMPALSIAYALMGCFCWFEPTGGDTSRVWVVSTN